MGSDLKDIVPGVPSTVGEWRVQLQIKVDTVEREIRTLSSSLDELEDNITTKKEIEKFETDIKNDIKAIQDSIHKLNNDLTDRFNDPEKGLNVRLKTLENWQSMINKVIWILIGTSIGLVAAVIKKFVLG